MHLRNATLLCAAAFALAVDMTHATMTDGAPHALFGEFFKGVCDPGMCEALKNDCLKAGTKSQEECLTYQVVCIQHLCKGRSAR